MFLFFLLASILASHVDSYKGNIICNYLALLDRTGSDSIIRFIQNVNHTHAENWDQVSEVAVKRLKLDFSVHNISQKLSKGNKEQKIFNFSHHLSVQKPQSKYTEWTRKIVNHDMLEQHWWFITSMRTYFAYWSKITCSWSGWGRHLTPHF